MAKRTNRVAWALVVLLAVMVWRLWAGPSPGCFTYAKATRLLATSVPIGSDKQEVLRFLEIGGWQHSGYTAPALNLRKDPNRWEYQAEGVISAMRMRGWCGGKIGVGFAFDARGKLFRVSVEQTIL
jgi:hypothetical protein